jgi:hypothetical protein
MSAHAELRGLGDSLIKPIFVILLAVTVAWLPVMGADQGADQSAGQITALIPAATRNAHALRNKDGVLWNDLLQTTTNGRLRAGLTDGSILSLGSNSQLIVVKHDVASQQTSLEIDYGKLRNRVVKITQPNGKFEVKTPNAVIGVIGTDFYVGYENDLTTVICYVGKVSVTPLGNAKIMRKSENVQAAAMLATLLPGQLVVIGTKIPPGGFLPESEVIRASMEDTNVNPHVFVARPKVWIPILTGVIGGIGIGIAETHGGGSSATIPPPVVCNVASSRMSCQK